MDFLQKITIPEWTLENGTIIKNVNIFYQTFGLPIGSAPIVLVNHTLTGNSNVLEWWGNIVGENKAIDIKKFSIIAFNIPGNGYEENPTYFSNYTDFRAIDVAVLFWEALHRLSIDNLFAVIGGSLGGGIAWEMAVLNPEAIRNLIPIASDYRSSDWVLANALIQDKLLSHSRKPLEDARMHAMLLYRTPLSLKYKFQRQHIDGNDQFQVESWLKKHGEKLKNRFSLPAYKLMNQLLKTIDITHNRADFVTVAKNIKSDIHIVCINTDGLFTQEDNLEIFELLKPHKANTYYNEIKSIHGHDAFLIESDKLSQILIPIFTFY
ncbi:MAG: alpha/beta fold hydrolase [Flavobacteriaceae bacterium]|jgi:homoserine O-acetyltransferase|nr:alpha/beta fold hydrolase [Flavobacteriaceae bacterium]